jgi:hypothetical protein
LKNKSTSKSTVKSTAKNAKARVRSSGTSKSSAKAKIAGPVINNLWDMLGLRYKSHPWHGVDIGSEAPEVVTAFIEVVPSDTVKYEIDKKTGHLKLDSLKNFLILFLLFMALSLKLTVTKLLLIFVCTIRV